MLDIFKKIWKLSEKRHSSLVRGLVISFIRSVFGLTQIFAIMLAIEVLMGKAQADWAVKVIIGLTVVCVVGNFVTSYLEQISTMETGFFMTGDARVGVGNKLRKVPLGFFNQTVSGKVVATLTTTLTGMETAAPMVMIGVISGLFSTAALFIFMMFYDWRIGLVSGAGMVVYLLVVNWQMKVSRDNAGPREEAQTKLTESALTFLQGIKVMKAFSFKKGDDKLKDAIDGSCKANLDLTRVSMPSQVISFLVIAVFESIILIYSLYLCFVKGDIDLVKTVILMIFSFMVYASLNQAGSMLSMIGLLDTCLTEITKIQNADQLEEREPMEDAKGQEIVFDQVDFSYDDHKVLKNISTTIKEKSLTAVIGPSGSGKTTLCQLIPRFRDIDSGKITIGGADITHMDYEHLMSKIAMVFQNVYLFEDTILNNIRFGKPDATLEEVRAAAKAARCDDFIMALPKGYDILVEEGGSNLSGGEKQRISIARAMIKDADIIILDEATSALDAENEHEILAAIDQLIKDKTVIMIAHRLKTVEKADKIIAIDNGEIVQEGTHEELSSQEGLYRDFLNMRKKAAGWQL